MAKKKNRVSGCLTAIWKFFWLGFFGIYILGAIIGGISSIFEDDTENVKLADGFTIEGYNVVLDVKEDNKVYVTEYITVDWNESYHHGIYKFTPQWLKYTGKDGKTIKRKSTVTNLTATGDPYSTDWVKKKARIKIGSANEYVPLGEKQYQISYTYDMGKDPFKNFDEFIFHAYGDYWGTEIKNATIQVNMPKSIDGYNINFFTDKERENNVTQFVDYEVKNNSLYAKFDGEKYREYQYDKYCSDEWNLNSDGTCDEYMFKYDYKPLEKSLTVDIELPDNYFVGGSWNYGWGSFIIIMIIIGLTILTIYKWIKYGKNFPKRSKTVEFYPPENYSSAEVGYIYNRYSTKKLTISLIVQLASKGYIKIDELDDKDKNIQITNLYPKPEELPKFDKTIPKRIISIKKLKNDDSNLSRSAVTMMTHLFKKGDTKDLSSSIDKFLEVKDELVNGGYIEIISDNENDPSRKIEILKKQYEEKEIEYHKEMEKYYDTISKLKPLSEYEREVYERLFDNENVIIVSEHRTLYKSFDEIDSLLKSKLKDKIIDSKATKKMVTSILISILVFALHFIGYCLVEDMSPSWNLLYVLSFICIFINIFFTLFMKRKTEYGEEIIAKVMGFRNFLITAEKPKLEQLVSQNPSYFYDILPYTYALNISKTWIRKFEDIPIPEIDMGSMNYSSDRALYSIYDNLYRPEPVHSSGGSSSSSGCSSCGGGCSSCGGGCSSCGGGGSW